MKGNGGNDTIFGGSGSDTINGNNGDDTIVGGFGADNLTGSNGNDQFVYLSAADSNATRFDTITDFQSKSDTIDVTALGALTFMALSSTSTTVPPHTIAWIYDSATNQTIVYVNPTDQTLSIGSPGLLEIHLQGVVSVESLDFVFVAAAPAAAAVEPINLELAAMAETDAAVLAMTVADGSSEGTVNLTDATAQTIDVGFGFDADRDRFDFDHARFASFGEDRTQPTQGTDDNAVVTPKNVQLVVPHHVTELTANGFAFDPAPASAMTAYDAVMYPNGAIHNASITAPNAPYMTELQLNVQGQAPEGSGGNAPSHGHGNPGSEINPIVALNNDENLGVPEDSGKQGPAVASPVENSGEPPTHGDDHSIPADASGNAPSHSHGNPGSEMNPIVALNNDENLGVPEASGKHGPAIASPVREFRGAADPSTATHRLTANGKPGSEMNATVALNNDENPGVPDVSGKHGPAVENSAEPPTHGNDHSIPADASEHARQRSFDPGRRKRTWQRTI